MPPSAIASCARSMSAESREEEPEVDAGVGEPRDGREHVAGAPLGDEVEQREDTRPRARGPAPRARAPAVTAPSAPIESTWSVSESASRRPPSAARAIMPSASTSYVTPSLSSTRARRSRISAGPMRLRSKRCSRLSIGAAACAIFCGSVVANTNTTRGGGSSRILRSAFHASRVSMCASSTM